MGKIRSRKHVHTKAVAKAAKAKKDVGQLQAAQKAAVDAMDGIKWDVPALNLLPSLDLPAAESAVAAPRATAAAPRDPVAEDEEPGRAPPPLHHPTAKERKETKRLRRRAQFISKLSIVDAHEKKKKALAWKKKNPPVLVGDLTGLQAALEDAVPDAEIAAGKQADAEARQAKPPPPRAPAMTSTRARKDNLKLESANMQAVLSHPQFRINATATIKEHLKNAIAAERKAAGIVAPKLAVKKLPKKKTKAGKQQQQHKQRPGKHTQQQQQQQHGAGKMGKMGKGGRLSKR